MNGSVIGLLELEWAHHKYAVLEKDPAIYQSIRLLLKNKQDPDAETFHRLIKAAYAQPDLEGRQDNAIQHVWGYFKKCASPEEKAAFAIKYSLWLQNQITLKVLKQELFVLSEKYAMTYLLNSTYFDEVRSV